MGTKVYVVGWPVAHSLSPLMHEAAYSAIGLNWTYSRLAVKPSKLRRTLADLRDDPQTVGINITIPHKQAVLAAIPAADATAAAVGAANTLVRRPDGTFAAHNTDVLGFIRCLEHLGAQTIGRVLLLGAGGSARACAAGLRDAGAKSIGIVARRTGQAESLVRDLRIASSDQCGAPGTGGALPVWPWPARYQALEWLSRGTGQPLLVNTTPLGMWPEAHLSPLAAEHLKRLPSDALVVDLIYRPRETKLLQAAKAAGLTSVGGAEMLVQQGLSSLGLWLGRDPGAEALTAMRQAVQSALEEGSSDVASDNRR